jgi:DNA-binding transcriptional ArsR family regulator
MAPPTAFEVVAEPTRRRILDLLLDGERPVGDLVTDLGMNQPGVSRHLRVLRDAGLVSSRTDAQRRLYSVNPGPLAELDTWLAPYRRLWAGRLDQLEAHLDDMTDEPGASLTGERPKGKP